MSVKPGEEIKQLNISGGSTNNGNRVRSYNLEGGIVHELNIRGDFLANGNNSIAVAATNNGRTPLANISQYQNRELPFKFQKVKLLAVQDLLLKVPR